jgi:hypothetical protein
MSDDGIKIGSFGIVSGGQLDGWNVFIKDDEENTGGYLILYTSPPEKFSREGYDDWVEDLESLRMYFSTAEWKVQWSKDA